MTENQTNILAAMVRVITASLEEPPWVIYTDPFLDPTLDLLPSDWPRKKVHTEDFSNEVTATLLDSAVFAIPPWGRQPKSKVPLEVAALADLRAPSDAVDLIMLLPAGLFLSPGHSKQLRMDLMSNWNTELVAFLQGGIVGAHHYIHSALTKLSSSDKQRSVLRMFEVPQGRAFDEQAVLRDLGRILRMQGGKTEFGYILRDLPPSGAPLVFDQFHPDVVRRRGELPDYGRIAHLDHLFEVFQGTPRIADRSSRTREPGLGGQRVITGRSILAADRTIAPPDNKTEWVNADRSALAAEDIVISGIQSPNWVRPGLLWARVREADLPAAAGENAIVLRPRPDANPRDVDFVLRYLSSRDLLELSDDPRLTPGTTIITAPTIGAIRIPLPDEHLAEALTSVETAQVRAAAWAEEADEILSELFDAGGASISRQNVIQRSRIVRLRMKAVDEIDTLSGQVRTQYPLPIAYAWRSLEALKTRGPGREAYLAALDAGEHALAFSANVGLALALESGQAVSTLQQIAERLLRRQGPTLADWSNIIDELASDSFASIDSLISSTEFRDFCRDAEVAKARKVLLGRRNDESHQRRVEPMRLPAALDELHAHLEVIFASLSFFLDNTLIIARGLRWDSILEVGTLSFQRLAGDHPIVPTHEMQTKTPDTEVGSLYLLDSTERLHLLRPFLVGTDCAQCGTFSVFHVDRFVDETLTMKSMEHGHTIESSAELMEAAKEVGLILGASNSAGGSEDGQRGNRPPEQV